MANQDEPLCHEGELAAAHHVRLVSYEGGRHRVGIDGAEDDDTINALFDVGNRTRAWARRTRSRGAAPKLEALQTFIANDPLDPKKSCASNSSPGANVPTPSARPSRIRSVASTTSGAVNA